MPDTRLDASRTAVKQTRASIVHARALLKKAEYQFSHTVITSPIDGVVQERLVSLGDYLDPMSPAGRPLFRIVDDRHLRARLYLPDRLFGQVALGMRVTLRLNNQTIESRITHLRPMIEEGSRSLVALADFENRYHWPPGRRMSADVLLAEHPDALLIPEAVLVQRPEGERVYRVQHAHAQEVAPMTGIRHDGMVEVLSGLSEGDRLVLDGAAYLADGVRVSIAQGTEDSAK